MTGIKIEVDDKAVVTALNRLLTKLGNLNAPLHDIGKHLELSTDDRFDRKASPAGTAWPEIPAGSEYYKRKAAGKAGRKQRRGSNNPADLLFLTGDLRRLMRYQIEGNALIFGSDRLYAATHQKGDPSRNIPARPFLPIMPDESSLPPDDQAAILDILNDYLQVD